MYKRQRRTRRELPGLIVEVLGPRFPGVQPVPRNRDCAARCGAWGPTKHLRGAARAARSRAGRWKNPARRRRSDVAQATGSALRDVFVFGELPASADKVPEGHIDRAAVIREIIDGQRKCGWAQGSGLFIIVIPIRSARVQPVIGSAGYGTPTEGLDWPRDRRSGRWTVDCLLYTSRCV